MTVCLVLAHIGIPQNERADEAAKAAAESDAAVNNHKVHYKDCYPVLREEVHREWERGWRDIESNKLRAIEENVDPWDSSQQRNRSHEVTLGRLRIGHTRLTHGWLLKGGQPPMCPNCDEQLTVRHVLVECHHNSCIRTRIYPQTVGLNGQDTLKHILGEEGGTFDVAALMTFIAAVNLEHRI